MRKIGPFRAMVVLGALLGTFAPRSAHAVQHVLNFDELGDGFEFYPDVQPYAHLGISIEGMGPEGYSIPTAFRPGIGTASPPVALRNVPGGDREFGSTGQDIVVTFDGFTASYVRVFVGLVETNLGGDVIARMVAYSAVEGGGFQETVSVDRNIGHFATAPILPRELIIDRPAGDIARVKITYGLAGAEEIIDALLIREHDGPPVEPVADTMEPVVHIESPVDLATVGHSHLPVLGTVEEDGALVDVTAVTSVGSFPLAVRGESPTYYFAGFVDIEDVAGRHGIEVLATDGVSKVGSEKIDVDLDPVEYPPPPEPPPPDLDIVAMGLEVTQAIQGWGFVGPTDAGIDTSCRLISGKTTLVRVYAEATGTFTFVDGVNCMLEGYFNGPGGLEEFPDSPLLAMSPVQLWSGNEYEYDRGYPDKSFNFMLPHDWTTAGSVHLVATVNHFNGVTERPGAFDVHNTISRDVAFLDTRDDLCLIVYRFRFTNHENAVPTLEECNANLAFLRQLYPIPPARVSTAFPVILNTDAEFTDDSEENDETLHDWLKAFRRWLGFYYGRATAYPCGATVYLGLSDSSVQHRGSTTRNWPVSLSVASSGHFWRIKTAHEVGHAMGLHHVPGCGAGDPFESYPTYYEPFGDAYRGPSMGDFGVRFREGNALTMYTPDFSADIMSYCNSGDVGWDRRWMSPYTWERLASRFGAGEGRAMAAGEAPADGAGAAEGDPAPHYLVHGSVTPTGTVTLDPIWTTTLPEGSNDELGRGSYTLELRGLNDVLLFERRFEPLSVTDNEAYSFFDEIVPAVRGVTTVRLLGDKILKPIVVEAGAKGPAIEVTEPTSSDLWPATGERTIRWTATEPDGDPVVFTVFFSNDEGETWTVVAEQVRGLSVVVRLDGLPGAAKRCVVRVAGSDGIHQGSGESPGFFTKLGRAPYVEILQPDVIDLYPYGQTVTFEGLVSDPEHPVFPAENLEWLSDRDGPLGNGVITSATRLSPGLHVVRFEARDGDDMLAQDTVGVYIVPPGDSAVELPRTGQTQCTDSGGDTIGCSRTGQDGEIRAGVAWPKTRFTPNLDKTFTDQLTGLCWPQHEGTPDVGQCSGKAMSWQSALSYVECLNRAAYLGHRDWRLANVNELLSLFHAGETTGVEWLESYGFSNVQADPYWTSTTYAMDPKLAWAVRLRDGSANRQEKGRDYHVLPVRCGQEGLPEPGYPANVWRTGQTEIHRAGDDGDQQAGVIWPSPRFEDNGNGTVTDRLTHLTWMKHTDCLGANSWIDSLKAVASLNADPSQLKCQGYQASYRDWRLANFKELQSLVDFSRHEAALPLGHPFDLPEDGQYWSSTTLAPQPTHAWALSTRDGLIVPRVKMSELLAWPVRGGVTATPGGGEAHVAVTMTDNRDPAPAGSQVTYTVVVTNYGLDEAIDVELVDRPPSTAPLISYTTSQGSCRQSGDTITCDLGDMKRGETATVSVVVEAPATQRSMTNRATAESATGDPNLTDNEAEEQTTIRVGGLPDFIRGDCSGDGRTGGTNDALVMLTRNFIGGAKVPCRAACDTNGDGDTGGVMDALELLTHNFIGGVKIPAPFPDCGPTSRQSDYDLGCDSSPGCP